MKIFINAGHFVGKDSGAVGFGITEAEKVLSIGKQTEKYLSAAGLDTKFLQSDSLQEICQRRSQINHKKIPRTFRQRR